MASNNPDLSTEPESCSAIVHNPHKNTQNSPVLVSFFVLAYQARKNIESLAFDRFLYLPLEERNLRKVEGWKNLLSHGGDRRVFVFIAEPTTTCLF
ncbi:MAG TPA: hypothetical protein VK196_09885 [Magnetospirillum sp.]|nr:hypothetical protein [Magnetospirillum sp.]